MFNILVKVKHTHEFINCNKQLYFSVTSRLYVPLDVARIFHWVGGGTNRKSLVMTVS